MNITPSQNTLQAFGSSLSASAPAAQTRQPVAANQVEKPAPNATQRVDAAPRAEASARPEADAKPPAQASAQPDRPGARLDITV